MRNKADYATFFYHKKKETDRSIKHLELDVACKWRKGRKCECNEHVGKIGWQKFIKLNDLEEKDSMENLPRDGYKACFSRRLIRLVYFACVLQL